MDVLYYDHVNQRILMWGDTSNGKVWAFPVICGGLSADLHIITRDDVEVLNMGNPADQVIDLGNGTKEFVWQLTEVDNRGKNIELSVEFTGMTEGESRPVFSAAYFEYANTFAPDEIITVPLDVPEMRVHSNVSITPSTNQTSYPAETEVEITVTVDNKNDYEFSGRYELVITDMNDYEVYRFTDTTVPVIGAQGALDFPMRWNTAFSLAGEYQLKAKLFNLRDEVMALGETLFAVTVTGDKASAVLDSSLTTDKLVYSEKETISVSGLIKNVTNNAIQPSSTATIVVKDPNGQVIANRELNVRELYPSSFEQVAMTLPSGSAIDGDYSAELVVVDTNNKVLTTSTTLFKVVADVRYQLIGEIKAEQKVITPEDTNSCLQTVINTGDYTIKGLPLRYMLLHVDSDAVYGTSENTVDMGSGTADKKTQAIAKDTLIPGDYLCVLQAKLPDAVLSKSTLKANTPWTTLAYDSFQVIVVDKSGVSGVVYIDENENGLRDSGESGVKDVEIQLLDSVNKTVVASTTTDSDGFYQMHNVTPGVYLLDINQAHIGLIGMELFTGVDQKSVDLKQSSALTSQNYGFRNIPVPQYGSIQGYVWYDDNTNSLMDNTEVGIGHITLELVDSSNNQVIAVATSNSDGQFVFANLNAGDYFIRVLGLPDYYKISEIVTTLPSGQIGSMFRGNGQTGQMSILNTNIVVVGLGLSNRSEPLKSIPVFSSTRLLLIYVLLLIIAMVFYRRYNRKTVFSSNHSNREV